MTKKTFNSARLSWALLAVGFAVFVSGCAHTRNSCWQRKEDKTLTGDYMNCMRDVKLAPRVNACFADQSKKEPGFHMRIITAYDVTPAGTVKNAKLLPEDPGHPELKKCMLSAVNDQKYLKSENGDVHVELPWILHGETNSIFQF